MLQRNLQFLVNRRGQAATLVKLSYGSYDPAAGTNSSSTETTYTVKAYFGEYTLEELDSDAVSVGDRRVLIAAKDTSGSAIPIPDAEDIIRGVGDEVIVKSVQKIYNSSALVCYICTVRE